MLERLADRLLPFVEALALEELEIGYASESPTRRIYVPILLTTAKLQVCTYDPAGIELATGEIPDATLRKCPLCDSARASPLTSRRGTCRAI